MTDLTEARMDEGAASRVQPPTNRLRDLVALTKPRITLMVLISASAGFILGAGGRVSIRELIVAVVGIGLVAGGTSALNQVLERDVDALMRRTRDRPLPTGGVTPAAGALFSTGVALSGLAVLAVLVNGITAVLAAVALFSYVLIYTPLKRVSSLSTLVGAVPGALPLMGGWMAATGSPCVSGMPTDR